MIKFLRYIKYKVATHDLKQIKPRLQHQNTSQPNWTRWWQIAWLPPSKVCYRDITRPTEHLFNCLSISYRWHAGIQTIRDVHEYTNYLATSMECWFIDGEIVFSLWISVRVALCRKTIWLVLATQVTQEISSSFKIFAECRKTFTLTLLEFNFTFKTCISSSLKGLLRGKYVPNGVFSLSFVGSFE